MIPALKELTIYQGKTDKLDNMIHITIYASNAIRVHTKRINSAQYKNEHLMLKAEFRHTMKLKANNLHKNEK